MKQRVLHAVGIALIVASPMWITIEKPPNYFTFGISSLVLGILLLVLGRLSVKHRG